MVKYTGPLLGYNNNVPYKGHVYHVQTEDSGSRRPHVITHLFADGGRIIKTKKTSYAKHVGAEHHTERVRTLMRMQHKEMVISLREGVVDHLIEPPEGADPNEIAKDAVETGELGDDAPIASKETPSDDRDFQREMEALAGAEEASVTARGADAGARAEAARRAAAEAIEEVEAEPDDEDEGDEEKETTYKFVGRSGPPSKRRSGPSPASAAPVRSSPPHGRSSPPPARGRGGALPLKKRAKSDAPAPSGPAHFGAQYISDTRFDELVMSFFAS